MASGSVLLFALFLYITIVSTSEPLPNYDYFADDFVPSSSGASSPKQKSLAPSGKPFAHFETSLNIPTFKLISQSDSGKKKRGSSSSPEQAARAALEADLESYKLNYGDLSNIVLDHVHDTGFGPIIVIFKQELNGLEVVNLRLKVTLSRDMIPVSIAGYLSPAVRSRLAESTVSPTKAASFGLHDLLNTPITDQANAVAETSANKWKVEVEGVSKPIRVEKVAYFTGTQILPAYYLETYISEPTEHLYSQLISAIDGKLLGRRSLTHKAGALYTYRLYADDTSPFTPFDGPQGTGFNPYPSTTKDDKLTLQWLSANSIQLSNAPFSKNDPWLADDANSTIGNNANVWAYRAPSAEYRPTFVNRAQTCLYDPSLDAEKTDDQFCVAVSAVFYMLNWLHDWFYDAGFNEAAGNAQTNNYGRGGEQGDPILAQLHDPSGVENADMTTPKDGESPIMRMYLFPRVNTADVFILSPQTGRSTGALASRWGPTTADITADIVVTNDNVDLTSDGCQPIINDARGKILAMELSGCDVSNKTRNAAAAGAIAIVLFTQPTTQIKDLDAALNKQYAGNTLVMVLLPADSNDMRTLFQAAGTIPINIRLVRNYERWDGAIDNTIVAHEWGHYLAHRLATLINHQSGAMGEGWSDFVALMMTAREEDSKVATNLQWNGAYAVAAYSGQYLKRPYSPYTGIRRLPYSTDMAKNPLTFKHITKGMPLPLDNLGNTTDASANNEIHNAGEVWCLVLWECYASLLRDTLGTTPRLTFKEAQMRMKNYLVASLKGLPANPTYLEARDSVLVAASQADPVDYQLFCTSFAKRGMGLTAVAPERGSSTFGDIKESYYCGPVLKVTRFSLKDDVLSCDNDGILDRGEMGTINVTIENLSLSNMTNTDIKVQVECSEPNLIFTFGNSKTIGSLKGSSKLVLSYAVNFSQNADLSKKYDTFITISFVNARDIQADSSVFPFSFNYNLNPRTSTEDQILSADRYWQIDQPSDQPVWELIDGTDYGFTGFIYHGNDLNALSHGSLVSPDLVVSNDNFTIQYDHSYKFESDDESGVNFDGAVVEMFSNNQWVDLMPYTASFKKLNKLFAMTNNSLAGRLAYTSKSEGYPNPTRETIVLGNIFAGQTVKFRFSIGTDLQAGSMGWAIKNIKFTGITNTPFAGVYAQTCTSFATVKPSQPQTESPLYISASSTISSTSMIISQVIGIISILLCL